MTAGGFRVGTEDLADTAAKTDELAVRVQAAADGGRPIAPLAYGLAGHSFAAIALLAADVLRDGLGALALGTGRGADGLRATGDDYLAVERAATLSFDGLAR